MSGITVKMLHELREGVCDASENWPKYSFVRF